jgi:hypothetical protein
VKILALCYPTFNGKLHVCGPKQNYILLAPNDILRALERRGICVELVSLFQPVPFPLPCGMRLRDIGEATPGADVYLHMFRDPTEPEVVEKLKALGLPPRPTLNDAFKLRDHSKWKYLPVLIRRGLASEIVTPPKDVQWGPSYHNVKISADGKLIESAAFNNNHWQYPERRGRERIVTRFVDNATNGIRSAFRIGYVLGRFTTGWLYMTAAERRVIKSGNYAHATPFDLPRRHARPLGEALKELDVDYCHIEGCFVHDKMFVFDINPHPTSCGNTMSYITEDLAEIMIERLQEILKGDTR